MFSWSNSLWPKQQSSSDREQQAETVARSNPITISERWDVLGPFQIGTREAPWGADPLEQQGGFRSLSISEEQAYRSSLSPDGISRWSKQSIPLFEHHETAIEVKGNFKFPEVNWQNLQKVFGWSALQYQGWARAILTCKAPVPLRVAVYTENVLEFWIDNEHFFGGDFFAFRTAPLVTILSPGRHRLDLRLVRDVRSMGGVGDPEHPISVRIELCSDELRTDKSKILLPELINGRGFPTPYGSIPLCNASMEHIFIRDVQSLDGFFDVTPLRPGVVGLAPGQSRSFGFRVKAKSQVTSPLRFVLLYTVGISEELRLHNIETTVKLRSIREPIKSTFLHPSGIVAYCVVVPPREETEVTTLKRKALPVLLNLHGAGVEAQNPLLRHQLDAANPISAWTIIPEGGTPWSGDDWHTWGFADVLAAIGSIPDWIKEVSWKGPFVDLCRWYVVGHSNGGQGCWVAITHYPDQVVAAAPCSAYSSIQAYVSYNLWTEMDPRISACIESALAHWRHELLLPNIAGIPLLEQHGSADDNVPVTHSRRMRQLLGLLGYPPKYNELAGREHYFKGIMTTPFMCQLYRQIARDEDVVPELPSRFRLVVPNSHMFGSRGGIQVDQLEVATRIGHIDVERQDCGQFWKLQTSNIHRFHFSRAELANTCQKVLIDGSIFENISPDSSFVQGYDGTWGLTRDDGWRLYERCGRQLGAMEAILATKDTFVIRYFSPLVFPVALQISRNAFQYFGADSEIVQGSEDSAYRGNQVTIAIAEEPGAWRADLPISRTTAGISITTRTGRRHHYPLEEGMGIIYLAPLRDEALELCIWGHDASGLSQAARLFPMLTGTGQPDFVVVGKECRWSGAAGVKSMGFFDYDWKVSECSYL